ncbi:MAG: hypothetical protein ACK56I_16170, partial [bacterium]
MFVVFLGDAFSTHKNLTRLVKQVIRSLVVTAQWPPCRFLHIDGLIGCADKLVITCHSHSLMSDCHVITHELLTLNAVVC